MENKNKNNKHFHFSTLTTFILFPISLSWLHIALGVNYSCSTNLQKNMKTHYILKYVVLTIVFHIPHSSYRCSFAPLGAIASITL